MILKINELCRNIKDVDVNNLIHSITIELKPEEIVELEDDLEKMLKGFTLIEGNPTKRKLTTVAMRDVTGIYVKIKPKE